MRLGEIKGICGKFQLIKTKAGKSQCSFLLPDGEFCQLGTEFQCRVVVAIRAEKDRISGKPVQLSLGESASVTSAASSEPSASEQAGPISSEPTGSGQSSSEESSQPSQPEQSLPTRNDSADPGNLAEPLPPSPAPAPAPRIKNPEPPPAVLPEATLPEELVISMDEAVQAAPVLAAPSQAKLDLAGPAPIMDFSTWSYSRIECGLDCLLKFWLRYYAKMPELVRAKALILGKAFHEARAAIDEERPWGIPSEIISDSDLSQDEMKLRVVLEGWLKFRPIPPEGVNEIKVEFDIENSEGQPIHMIGFVDKLHKDVIYEFKYSVDPDAYTPHSTSRQSAVYLQGIPAARKVVHVVVKKPRLRLATNESDANFRDRLWKSIEKDSGKGLCELIEKHRAEIHVERELMSMADAVTNCIIQPMVKYSQLGKLPPSSRNQFKCPSCGYYPFCLQIQEQSCNFPMKSAGCLKCKLFEQCTAARKMFGEE